MSRVNDALLKAGGEVVDAGPHAATSPLAFPGESGTEPAAAPAIGDTSARRGALDRATPAHAQAGAPPEDLFPAVARKRSKVLLTTTMDARPVEEYRRLGARLHLAQAENGSSVIMVTSALVGEGKTLTASNLALTLSQSYKRRVLLIDADLRRPAVHELFSIPNVSGLNDGVRADTDRKVPLVAVTDRLSVLTAGRPDADPMTVLSSPRMHRVLQEASAAFDFVIIDTPPIGLLSDAHVLASLVHSVVLVVRAGVTPLHAIRAAATAVGRERIAGVVLNCADRPRASEYDYAYYRSHVATAKGDL